MNDANSTSYETLTFSVTNHVATLTLNAAAFPAASGGTITAAAGANTGNGTIGSLSVGGAVTMTTAPASGHSLQIERVLTYTQPTDFRNQGRLK